MAQLDILRVFCMDGTCPGPKLMHRPTGRILLAGIEEGHQYIYRLDRTTHVRTAPRINAYFERTNSAFARLRH
jgi:hypothetical protein